MLYSRSLEDALGTIEAAGGNELAVWSE